MDELTFSFGTKVHCLDDTYGSLGRIALNPETFQVADLIVENGFLFKRARVVPMSLVSSISEDGIYLSASQDEMRQLFEYREVKMERPADSPSGTGQPARSHLDDTMSISPMVPMVTEIIREGVSPWMKVLSPHTAVQNENGAIGKVQGVHVWATDNTVSGILSRQGIFFPETDTIPAHEIDHFDETAVALKSHSHPLSG